MERNLFHEIVTLELISIEVFIKHAPRLRGYGFFVVQLLATFWKKNFMSVDFVLYYLTRSVPLAML